MIEEQKKYTVKEVLDSLYFSELDHDDDFDGFLHLTSTINGAGTKIKITDLKVIEKYYSTAERSRLREEIIKLRTQGSSYNAGGGEEAGWHYAFDDILSLLQP